MIQSSTFNTLVADIGNTFNNVLPRDGQASMAGQLKLTDGTSSVPGIAFNSEASSGIYRPSAGMMALVASGVEVMRLNSAGRVLIGSPADDGTNKLQVTGAAKITGPLAVTGALVVSGAITGQVTGNISGTAANVTGVVAVANGGTGVATLTGLAHGNGNGAFTAATAAQVVNTLGFLPYNSTNPNGYQNATQLAAVAATYLPLTGGSLTGNLIFNENTGLYGKTSDGVTRQILNIGGDDNLNFTVPGGRSINIYNQSGSAVQWGLNNTGNTVQTGTVTANGIISNGNITASGNLTTTGQANVNGIIYAQSSQNLKIALMTGPSINGYIASDAGNCFRTINSTNGLYTLNVDNSGNLSVPGHINASYIGSNGNVNAAGTFTGGAVNVTGQLTGSSAYISQASNATITWNNSNFNMYIRMTNGSGGMEWINSAYSAVIATITQGGAFSANTVTALSDEKLKTNWRPVVSNFVEHLATLKSGVYDRIDLTEDATQVGVGAQSLQRFMPEAIMVREDGTLTVNYGGAAMVSVVELAKLVLKLEARIAELEAV